MKITHIDTFVVDAGWRPWQFVAVRTDEGITGYGECSDGRMPYSIVGTAKEFEAILKNQDPCAVEARYWDMYRMARQSPGGIAAKAIAGIELALWDIKAKSLNVPVYELLGGPLRTRQRVYWSHCGSSRAGNHEILGTPQIRTWDDITNLGKEVVARGFTALKTNIVFPGEVASTYRGGFGGGEGTTDGNVTNELLDHIRTLIGTFRDAVGPYVDIALDLNFNFRTEAATRICRILEDLRMMWVEIDMYEPDALREIRDAVAVPVCSGENLFTSREYRRYFEARSMDVCMVDVPWNGFANSRRVVEMAETFEVNCAPHNYYSHLSTLHSLHLCNISPNIRICEIDIDDVPWKDDLVTEPLDFDSGCVVIPDRPGWGADLNEEIARQHVWKPGRLPGYWSGRAKK
ncbi:MAG: mandelate racemase/muconate lactonizing enzyme family protein [Gammaproteobacteria bacterium]|nr:mandelate racemase/muconate lactonizing enzyme family protein [Gammaproteobacteria bacterium]MYD79712.1 mandelate racemase/muconate lactonizing enzyme family protein [Gammaproteobacteria bacterium]